MPTDVLASALELESGDQTHVVEHAISGLERHNLIVPGSRVLDGRSLLLFFAMQQHGSLNREIQSGVVFQPTQFGVELFLGAHGLLPVPFRSFLENGVDCTQFVEFPPTVDDCYLVPKVDVDSAVTKQLQRDVERLTQDSVSRKSPFHPLDSRHPNYRT